MTMNNPCENPDFVQEALLKLSQIMERATETMQKGLVIMQDHSARLEKLERKLTDLEQFVYARPERLDPGAQSESDTANSPANGQSESDALRAAERARLQDIFDDQAPGNQVPLLHCADCGKSVEMEYTDETQRYVKVEAFIDWSFNSRDGWRCPDCTVGHERGQLDDESLADR